MIVRGLTVAGISLRPQVKLIEGRWYQPGRAKSWSAAASTTASKAWNSVVSTRFAGRDWRIVGVFDGGASALTPEAWGTLSSSVRRSVVWLLQRDCADD